MISLPARPTEYDRGYRAGLVEADRRMNWITLGQHGPISTLVERRVAEARAALRAREEAIEARERKLIEQGNMLDEVGKERVRIVNEAAERARAAEARADAAEAEARHWKRVALAGQIDAVPDGGELSVTPDARGALTVATDAVAVAPAPVVSAKRTWRAAQTWVERLLRLPWTLTLP